MLRGARLGGVRLPMEAVGTQAPIGSFAAVRGPSDAPGVRSNAKLPDIDVGGMHRSQPLVFRRVRAIGTPRTKPADAYRCGVPHGVNILRFHDLMIGRMRAHRAKVTKFFTDSTASDVSTALLRTSAHGIAQRLEHAPE